MQRGGAETTVSCRVNDNGVDVENGSHIPFAKIDRLVEDDQYFYIFQSRQMAVMIPKAACCRQTRSGSQRCLPRRPARTGSAPRACGGST